MEHISPIVARLLGVGATNAPPPEPAGIPPTTPLPRKRPVPLPPVDRYRSTPWRRALECRHDDDCSKAHHLCIEHACVPRCHDSDAGFAEDLMDAQEQFSTPGHTMAWVPHAGPGKQIVWQSIDVVDGCKTDTLLLEYSCIAPEGGALGPPHFAYQYLMCPVGTSCQAVTDNGSGLTAAACAPTPVSPAAPELCVGVPPATWIPLGEPSGVIYDLHQHGATLFAGGPGGVRCWDPDAQFWESLDNGWASPAWLAAPMVVSLTTYDGVLHAVMVNSAGPRLHHWEPAQNAWTPEASEPAGVRVVLGQPEALYAGAADGVYRWDGGDWQLLGAPLPSTVKTLAAPAGDPLLAGLFNGGIVAVAPGSALTWSATPALSLNYVHALARYGEFLYVGAEYAMVRCWTESGVWDGAASCEPIEPETGISSDESALAFHTHNGLFYVGTSHGAYRFDATLDHWDALPEGFVPPPLGGSMAVFSLATSADALVAGTVAGVYHWCE